MTRVVTAVSPKNKAAAAMIKPMPKVAALVETEMRKYRSGMRNSPTAAKSTNKLPKAAKNMITKSTIVPSFFNVVSESHRAQKGN